jgi:cell division protein FtsB
MTICETHDVAYTAEECPACELEVKVKDAERAHDNTREEVTDLEQEVSDLQDTVAELKRLAAEANGDM